MTLRAPLLLPVPLLWLPEAWAMLLLKEHRFPTQTIKAWWVWAPVLAFLGIVYFVT